MRAPLFATTARKRGVARRGRIESTDAPVVSLSSLAAWIHLHRKWIAIGVAMIAPWIWMTGLDRLLRRTR